MASQARNYDIIAWIECWITYSQTVLSFSSPTPGWPLSGMHTDQPLSDVSSSVSSCASFILAFFSSSLDFSHLHHSSLPASLSSLCQFFSKLLSSPTASLLSLTLPATMPQINLSLHHPSQEGFRIGFQPSRILCLQAALENMRPSL